MTWERGDLALALRSGRYITKGHVYNVNKVVGPLIWANGDEGYGLLFDNAYHLDNSLWNGIFWAGHFTKLPPLTRREHDEFLTDLEFDQRVIEVRKEYPRKKEHKA